jgi:hypothetical protein
LKKFIDDDKLNKIRLDKSLFHLLKSQGSYIDLRTGHLTSSDKKAKEKMYPIRCLGQINEDSTEQTKKKIRKCPPRCVMCCAVSNPNDEDSKIMQTTMYCFMCLVSLCTKKKGNRTASCFEIFHQMQDLSVLRGKSESSEVQSSSSKERKAVDKTDK